MAESKQTAIAMHEARTDFCMLLGLVALVLLGPGTKALGRKRAN